MTRARGQDTAFSDGVVVGIFAAVALQAFVGGDWLAGSLSALAAAAVSAASVLRRGRRG